MSLKMMAGLAGAALFLLALIYLYNRLVRLRYSVRNSWSDIDVFLKKRYDLVPNLVETVKGYAAHERAALESVIALRAAAAGSAPPGARAKAESQLTGALRQLLAVVEAYPDLKADGHFRALMAGLKEVEGSIEYARRFYNGAVKDYNIATQVFPINIVAAAFAFGPAEFFSVSDSEEREAVAVSLER